MWREELLLLVGDEGEAYVTDNCATEGGNVLPSL
jgi:hypothetical protein